MVPVPGIISSGIYIQSIVTGGYQELCRLDPLIYIPPGLIIDFTRKGSLTQPLHAAL